MATVKGVNRTIADASTVSHTLKPGKFAGVVRCMIDTYEASALSIGDKIEMGGDLPINSQVLAMAVIHDALGAATIDIGDAEDTDRYLNDYSVASAAIKWCDLADGVEYEVDNTTASTPDTQVLITTAGATITGTIKLLILFTND